VLRSVFVFPKLQLPLAASPQDRVRVPRRVPRATDMLITGFGDPSIPLSRGYTLRNGNQSMQVVGNLRPCLRVPELPAEKARITTGIIAH
jgi:hypothetical protein